jgi:hypothetical protein
VIAESPGTSLETPSSAKNRNYAPLLIFIAVLLTVMLSINAIQFVMTFQQNQITAQKAATYEERVKNAQDLVTRQQAVISGLVDEYQKAAYQTPGVDRIAEQQLIAAESTLGALQILAIQNSQIIELLANAP